MSTTLQLDIPLLLPETGDACDACVNRLITDLEGRDGVEKAHVIASEGGREAKLCTHYGPDILPLPRIREIVQAAGAAMTERFGHVLWQVEGIGHQRRARTVGDTLRAVPGVLEAEADAAGLVRIEFDRNAVSEEAIRDVLSGLGLHFRERMAPPRPTKHDHAHEAHDDHAHVGQAHWR
jgi:Zn2+/Cd2+-exporting ATPase